MENFRVTIKKRICFFILLAAVMVAGIILLTVFGRANDGFNATSGILGAVLAIALGNVITAKMALGNEAKLKEMYIKHTDERSAQITKEASTTTFRVILLGISAATIIANFLSETVSCTLSVCLAFIFMVYITVSSYYNRKM